VKLIEADKERFVFHVGKREKLLLLGVLKLYPLVPPAHHRLSKKSGTSEATRERQHLLEEALAEQRSANKKHLEKFLNDPARFCEMEPGFRLTLSPGDLEWLLQVLNDIRIGGWLLLGCPDEGSKGVKLTTKTARYFWAMEMSGFFQMSLLAAVERGKS
jgi:hypothetical protein